MEAITQGMGDKYGLLETKVFPAVMVHLFRSCTFSIRRRLEEERVKGCNQHSIRVFYISMVMRIPGNVSAMVVGKNNEKEAEERRRITEKKKKTEREITEMIIIVRNMGNCLEQWFPYFSSARCSVCPRPKTPTWTQNVPVN